MALKAAYLFKTGALETDSSGNGNTLTSGGTTSNVLGGPTNSARNYNGASGYSDIPFNCTNANARSVLFIFRMASGQSGNRKVFGFRNSNDHLSFDFDVSSSRNFSYTRYDDANPSSDDYIYPDAIPNLADVWQICGFIQKSAGGADSYADGKLQQTSVRNVNNPFADVGHWNIGCFINNGVRQGFNNIDVADFRIFDHELSPADYKNYYLSIKGFF